MAGHSKWANIRHRKAAVDAKKNKVLSKHSKILMIIGKTDPNPDTNAALRTAIANAKADNVPNDNIKRILKKLSGEGKDGAVYQEMVYECYAPAGVPVIITAITDNNNRTFSDIRTAVEKSGGTMGSTGSVGYMFDHIGVVYIKTEGKTEDEIFEIVINAGADDFTYDAEECEITCGFKALGGVRKSLEEMNMPITKSETQYRAKDAKLINDEEKLEKIEKFYDRVNDVDDVDEIFMGYVDSQ